MYALISAAVVLIIAGVALLLFDARRRSSHGLVDGQDTRAATSISHGAETNLAQLAGPKRPDRAAEAIASELTEDDVVIIDEAEEFAEPVEPDVAEVVAEPAPASGAWADAEPVELPEQLIPEAKQSSEAESSPTAQVAEQAPEEFMVADESIPLAERANEDVEQAVAHEKDELSAEPGAEAELSEFEGHNRDEGISRDIEQEAIEIAEVDLNDTAKAAQQDTGEGFDDDEGDATDDDAADINFESDDDFDSEEYSAPAPQKRNPLTGLLNLGGSLRRQRRDWANANGFDFAKEDRFLSEEWARGAAATGHSTRDVVSGAIDGREMHIADLGETTVVAVRRGAASNVVMDARRPESPVADDDADDLFEVGEAQGFTVYSNDEEAIHRMFDSRTEHALGTMPQEVTAVWAEGDWALAQLVERTSPQVWESTFVPLAELADCMRMLPPRAGVTTHFDEQLRDPSRPRPFTIQDDEQSDTNHRGHLRAVPAVPDAVVSMEEEPVWRPAQPPYLAPTEPVELPSRSRGTTHGDVANMPNIGGPAAGSNRVPGLPALGTDPEHSRASNTGGRIIRRLSTASTIFDDAAPTEDSASGNGAAPTDNEQKDSPDDPAAN